MENNMDKYAEYRERMQWAKEHGDKESFIKYYELYKIEYRKLTNRSFDDDFQE